MFKTPTNEESEEKPNQGHSHFPGVSKLKRLKSIFLEFKLKTGEIFIKLPLYKIVGGKIVQTTSSKTSPANRKTKANHVKNAIQRTKKNINSQRDRIELNITIAQGKIAEVMYLLDQLIKKKVLISKDGEKLFREKTISLLFYILCGIEGKNVRQMIESFKKKENRDDILHDLFED